MNLKEKTEDATFHKVDEALYSRQLYVLGHEGMMKIMNTNVLVIGCDGLGQEIAKNVCLAGVKSVSLFDKNPVTVRSLGSGFFFSKSSVGSPRDAAACEHLRSLNKYVKVMVTSELSFDLYDVVISVNQSLDNNLRLNSVCHSKNIKFIMANVNGLFGQVFCDFQNHVCIDKNGEASQSYTINDITPDGVLTLVNDTYHSLEDGDSVKIDDVVYKISVINRTQLKLHEYTAEKLRIGGDLEQVKVPFNIKFKSLAESLNSPTILNFDFANINRSQIIHDLFITGKQNDNSADSIELENQFNATKGVLITPMCSVVGGIAAQESIKACSSKFVPIQQFYYFDSSDAYLGSYDAEVSYDTRYHDIIRLFGQKGFEMIKNMKIFLVGAGAIGCENLKNFVTTGLGANGKISVTDMDSIEQSNLNRQFLFRQEDVSKMKSESAIKQVKKLNEDFCQTASSFSNSQGSPFMSQGTSTFNLEAFTKAVNAESETTFSDKFLMGFDLVSNALDNVEARAYMDKRCIQLRKPLIDAGTLGTKGHVQVVVPFVSESYSSSTDPQEKSIPLCTIKSYPYAIEHTIEWAMSEFKTHFYEKVGDVKEYLKTNYPALAEEYENAPKSVETCLKNALAMFVHNFSTSIQNLLNSFPPDHLDQDGNLFWTPPKRIPTPISFNVNDKLHISFVFSCANLLAECYGVRKITSEELFAYLQNIYSLTEPNNITFKDSDADYNNIKMIEFDKDTWHADFVHACANLRARNYSIKEKSKHFIRGIAGRIIPAIATTTAIVSGLSTIEILKYATRRDSNLNDSSTANACKLQSKNFYLDLAAPFLASTDLVAPKAQYYLANNKKIKYTIWSRLEFKDDLLSNIITKVQEKIGSEIGMISIGSRVIYWNLSDKYKDNLQKTISDLCKKKPGQLVCYIDVLPDEDVDDMIDVAIMFDE